MVGPRVLLGVLGVMPALGFLGRAHHLRNLRFALRRHHVHPPVRTAPVGTDSADRRGDAEVRGPAPAARSTTALQDTDEPAPAPETGSAVTSRPARRTGKQVVTESYSVRVNRRNTARHDPVYSNSDEGRLAAPAVPQPVGATAEEVSVEMNQVTLERLTQLPVRAGDDPWTVAEIEDVREELNDELTRLNEELADMEAELQDLLSEAVVEAGDDDADSGSKSFERDHEIALANSLRQMRDQVEAAIQRLDSGSFGLCKSCEEPIGKLRLQAFPQAQLCLACKQREERR